VKIELLQPTTNTPHRYGVSQNGETSKRASRAPSTLRGQAGVPPIGPPGHPFLCLCPLESEEGAASYTLDTLQACLEGGISRSGHPNPWNHREDAHG
jgi:hypothetical protein